ncbi:MAG: hypothetical protein RL741_1144 [Actinomycetota bacterium]|jgi:hypothetical protein
MHKQANRQEFGVVMTQRGRHRAPGRHARPKSRRVSLTTSAVATAAVLLTGGITAAANSNEQPLPYVDVAALAIDSTVTYDIRDHVVSSVVVTEEEDLAFTNAVTEDATIAIGTEITKRKGEVGKVEVAYQVKLVDDKEVTRSEVSRTVITEPVQEQIIRGTGDPKSFAIAIKVAEQKTGSRSGNKEYAKLWINQENGWGENQFACLETLWFRESNWNHKATNPTSGAYGIPQSLPGNKMATFGDDWRTNPATQIKWGADYIEERYGTPCQALNFFYNKNWY